MTALLSLNVSRHMTSGTGGADVRYLTTPPSSPQSPSTGYSASPASNGGNVVDMHHHHHQQQHKQQPPSPITYSSTDDRTGGVSLAKKRRKQSRPTFNGDAGSHSSSTDDAEETDKNHSGHQVEDRGREQDDGEEHKHGRFMTNSEPNSAMDSLMMFGNTFGQTMPRTIDASPSRFEGRAKMSPYVNDVLSRNDPDQISTVSMGSLHPASGLVNNKDIKSEELDRDRLLSNSALLLGDVPTQHFRLQSPSPPYLTASTPPHGLEGTPSSKHGSVRGEVEELSSDGELDSEALLDRAASVQAESCPQCNKVFKRRVYLQRHMTREHWTTAKIFKCEKCKYETKHQSNLLVHRRTHTGERPYHCGACGQRYTQGHLLKAHIRSRHDADLRFYNMDKRTDGVRCRRIVGKQAIGGMFTGFGSRLGMDVGAGSAGARDGIGSYGKDDHLRYLLQAADSGRLLGGTGTLNRLSGVMDNNGIGLSGYGGERLYGDDVKMFSTGAKKNEGFQTPTTNRRDLHNSSNSKTGGKSSVKEDRIRFLLHAAEASQQQRHSSPPASSSPAKSVYKQSQQQQLQQQQQLKQQQQQQQQELQHSAALAQYLNALSACLPNGLNSMLWPPAASALGGGSSLFGALGGAEYLGGLLGAGLPSLDDSRAALLSQLSLGGAGLGGGGVGEDLSATSSMLSAMLAKITGMSPDLSSMMSLTDNGAATGREQRDAAAAAAAEAAAVSTAAAATAAAMMMMMPQDLSTTGSRSGGGNERKTNSNSNTATEEYDRSKRIHSSSSSSTHSNEGAPAVQSSEMREGISAGGSPRSALSSQGDDEQAADLSKPRLSSVAMTSKYSTSSVFDSPSRNDGAQHGAHCGTLRGGMQNELLSKISTEVQQQQLESSKTPFLKNSLNQYDIASSPRLQNATGEGSIASGRSEQQLLIASRNPRVKQELVAPSMNGGRSDGMHSDGETCGNDHCPHLRKLRELRRNVYRMLRVFTPYLGTLGGVAAGDECLENGEGDAIDEFLHEVIYSKMDEGD